MSLLQRLRSVLGLDGTGAAENDDQAGVAVERAQRHREDRAPIESPTGGEASIDSAPVERDRESPTADPDTPSEPEPTEPTIEHDGAVTDISGIGPAYAERLGEAGIHTIGDLAGADPATVAARTDIAEGRVSTWIEDAREMAGVE